MSDIIAKNGDFRRVIVKQHKPMMIEYLRANLV